MKTCKKCKLESSDNLEFCSECGNKLNVLKSGGHKDMKKTVLGINIFVILGVIIILLIIIGIILLIFYNISRNTVSSEYQVLKNIDTISDYEVKVERKSFLNEKVKCKELSDKYVEKNQKEMDELAKNRNRKQEIRYVEVDYSSQIDTCLIMYSIFNVEYFPDGTFTDEFQFNTIHDLLGKYDSTCLLGGNDPISDQTNAKFHYLLTGEKLSGLTNEYINNINNFCSISIID